MQSFIVLKNDIKDRIAYKVITLGLNVYDNVLGYYSVLWEG